MLQHVVLLKTRPGLEKEKFDQIIKDARQVLSSIPGVSNLRAGESADADSEWRIVLSMDFENRDALEAYRVHPDHVAYVRNNLDENVIQRQAADFFFQSL
jgi:hypothetical protein